MEIRKISNILIVIFVCFISSLAYSQNFQSFFEDSLRRTNISIQSNYFYGSSSINNAFMNKFIYGGEITREEKDKIYEKLNTLNTFGADFNVNINAELKFDTLFGKTKLMMLVGAEMIEHADARFSADLFKLFMDGNKQFAGKYADLSKTNINYFSYQQLNFGLINYRTHNNKIAREGVIFSLIKGQEHTAVKIPRGTLFTEEFGREIELDLNYIYNNSDTASKKITAFNGLGVSTDLFSEFNLDENSKLYVAVNDLGFIQWNKKSIQIQADSLFTYDGVDVENIFDLNDSLVSSISRDSLLNLISNQRNKGSYAIALPTSINLMYSKQFNSKLKAEFGFRHKILANYFPWVYGNLYYYFKPNLVSQIHLSYGAYGTYNFGLAIAKSFKEKLQCYVGTHNVLGFLVPQYTNSGSAYIGLKMYF